MSSFLPSSPSSFPQRPSPSTAACVVRRRASARFTRVWTACAALTACALAGFGVSPAHADPSRDAPAGISGGTVHVCTDARGLREFRDTPCAPHQRSLRAIAFVRAAPDPALQAGSRDTAREMDRRNAAAQDRAARIVIARASARASGEARKAPDACERARTRRDEARERATSGLSFDQLRRLDRDVWLRCPNG